jgi:7-carboxy-7-deazaguanine synthase
MMRRLCDEAFEVSLETSGAFDIADIDTRVSVVMDLKTPSSGEIEKNRYANVALLQKKDQVKFVIGSREDYEWSRAALTEHALAGRCDVLFSPVFGRIEPGALADWILADHLPVRMQVQLHKILWGEARGR